MNISTIRPSDTHRANLVKNSIALEFGVDLNAKEYVTHRGGPRVVRARQIAMYLCHTVFNVNLTRVARAFQRDRSTARHACNMVEAWRDDPVLDAKISELESFLRLAPVPSDCR